MLGQILPGCYSHQLTLAVGKLKFGVLNVLVLKGALSKKTGYSLLITNATIISDNNIIN